MANHSTKTISIFIFNSGSNVLDKAHFQLCITGLLNQSKVAHMTAVRNYLNGSLIDFKFA